MMSMDAKIFGAKKARILFLFAISLNVGVTNHAEAANLREWWSKLRPGCERDATAPVPGTQVVAQEPIRPLPTAARDFQDILAGLHAKATKQTVTQIVEPFTAALMTGPQDTLSALRLIVDKATGLEEPLKRLGFERNELLKLIDQHASTLRQRVRESNVNMRREAGDYLSVVMLYAGLDAANAAGDAFVTPGHVLLGLLGPEFDGTLMDQFIKEFAKNLQAAKVAEQLRAVIPATGIKDRDFVLGSGKTSADGEGKYDPTKILVNVTEKARKGDVKDAKGMDHVKQVIWTTVNRLEKAAACLVGKAGTGKTTLIESMALDIINGRAPMEFLDSELFQLRATDLNKGTGIKGSLEEKLAAVIDYIQAKGKKAVLFIDEIHILMGDGDGKSDVINQLKDLLAGKGIRLIAADTLDEYRKFVKKDPAIERRLLPINLEEPTGPILQMIVDYSAKYYGTGHKVGFTPPAIALALKIAERFQPVHLANPDNTLEVLREAASFVDTMAQLFASTEQRLAGLNSKRNALGTDNSEAVVAERKRLTALIEADEVLLESYRRYVDRIVDEEAVIAAYKARNPSAPIMTAAEEAAHLDSFAARVGGVVLGQSQAIEAVQGRLRDRAEQYEMLDGRPLSVLVRAEHGVGSSFFADVLAKDQGRPILRVDCGEYPPGQGFSMTRLLGAPPGYVGYAPSAGKLSEHMSNYRFGMVVFENVEKAAPELVEIINRIIQDGHVSSGDGAVDVDFKNAIVIVNTKVDVKGATDPDAVRKALLDNPKIGMLVKNENLTVTSMGKLDDIALMQIMRARLAAYNSTIAGPNFGLRLEMSEDALRFALSKRNLDFKGAQGVKNAFIQQVENAFKTLNRAGKLPAGNQAEARVVNIYSLEGGLHFDSINEGEIVDVAGTVKSKPDPLVEVEVELPVEPEAKPGEPDAPGDGSGLDMETLMRQMRQGGGAGGPGTPGAGAPQGGDEARIYVPEGGPRRTIQRDGGNFKGVNHGVAPQQ